MKKLLLGDLVTNAGRIRPGGITAEVLAAALIFPNCTASTLYNGSGGPDDAMYQRIEGLFGHLPMPGPGQSETPEMRQQVDSANEELRLLTTGADAFKNACRAAESDGRIVWPIGGISRWELLAMLLRTNGIEVPAELPTEEYSVEAVGNWIKSASLPVEIL